MTRRDLAKLERQVKRAREDRKRLSEFAEAGPSFTPQSNGDGVEKNATLRDLDKRNRQQPVPTKRQQLERALRDGHIGTRPDFDVDPQTVRDIERRRPGFPSQWGKLAREAAEAQEPQPAPFEPWWTAFRLPWWLAIPLLICAGWVAVELYWMLKGRP